MDGHSAPGAHGIVDRDDGRNVLAFEQIGDNDRPPLEDILPKKVPGPGIEIRAISFLGILAPAARSDGLSASP
jgi:hypothetical protein